VVPLVMVIGASVLSESALLVEERDQLAELTPACSGRAAECFHLWPIQTRTGDRAAHPCLFDDDLDRRRTDGSVRPPRLGCSSEGGLSRLAHPQLACRDRKPRHDLAQCQVGERVVSSRHNGSGVHAKSDCRWWIPA